MTAVIACKLPNGLVIRHAGQEITLKGANIGENLRNPSENGNPNDNKDRAYGYGLTELSDKQAEVFADWAKAVTFRNGDPAAGKLAEPYPALESGAIMGPFKSRDEAIKELTTLAGSVSTGFEGLDPTNEKDIEQASEDEQDNKPAGRNRRNS
jgi:hypothetical protein